jgi:hypothetical protein
MLEPYARTYVTTSAPGIDLHRSPPGTIRSWGRSETRSRPGSRHHAHPCRRRALMLWTSSTPSCRTDSDRAVFPRLPVTRYPTPDTRKKVASFQLPAASCQQEPSDTRRPSPVSRRPTPQRVSSFRFCASKNRPTLDTRKKVARFQLPAASTVRRRNPSTPVARDRYLQGVDSIADQLGFPWTLRSLLIRRSRRPDPPSIVDDRLSDRSSMSGTSPRPGRTCLPTTERSRPAGYQQTRPR